MSKKDLKRQKLVEIALDLFLNNSIFATRISDVAKKAKVGEATVYRYFINKENLIIETSLYLSDMIKSRFFGHDPKNNNGFLMIKEFYMTYYRVYQEMPKAFCFIRELDGILIQKKVDSNRYEEYVSSYRDYFNNLYKKGVEDKSIRQIDDIDSYYFSTCHSLLSLCEKVSSVNVLRQDELIDKSEEILTAINVMLFYIKGE